MSAQTMADVFAPIEAKYHAQVIADTWGHLAPRKNKTYRGFVVFAVGCFGNDELNPTVLSCEFKDLDDSPWFYDALAEFIGSPNWNVETKAFPSGGVYRFDGSFRNYKFKGTFTRMKLVAE